MPKRALSPTMPMPPKAIKISEDPPILLSNLPNTLKIASFNVVSLLSCLKKGLISYLEQENADILLLQETKLSDTPLKPFIPSTLYPYQYYSHCSTKKGYAGIMVCTKTKPDKLVYGLKDTSLDDEGRVMTLYYPTFCIINAYVPNAGTGLKRLAYKQAFSLAIEKWICALDKERHVLYAGDLNVAVEEIDLTNPKTNHSTPGFTDQERHDFRRLLGNGFVDAFRHTYPEKREYTYFSYRNDAKRKNIGWRLDYFVLSNRIKQYIKDVVTRKEVSLSDHVPTILFLDEAFQKAKMSTEDEIPEGGEIE